MISVTVTMHANLRRFLPGGVGTAQMTLDDGTTVRRFIEGIDAHHDVWIVAINGEVAPQTAIIRDGDTLDCFEQLEGG